MTNMIVQNQLLVHKNDVAFQTTTYYAKNNSFETNFKISYGFVIPTNEFQIYFTYH